jgi:hypothetical protein
MCLGVAFRGDKDEEDWFGERQEYFEEYDIEHRDPSQIEPDEQKKEGEKYRSLVYWYGEHLMATRCSNEGAVIEWVVVPFIVEDDESQQDGEVTPQGSMSYDVEEL